MERYTLKNIIFEKPQNVTWIINFCFNKLTNFIQKYFLKLFVKTATSYNSKQNLVLVFHLNKFLLYV